MEVQENNSSKMLVKDYSNYPVQGYYVITCPNCGCNLHINHSELNDNDTIKCQCDANIDITPLRGNKF